MNKKQLTDKLHDLSKKKNVSFNILLQTYFFDRFLYRLSVSDYREAFVLKGGFLLSSMLGVESRSTLDMDFKVQDIEMRKDNMTRMIDTISRIYADDHVSFTVKKIASIMQFQEDTGYQVSLIGHLENIRLPFTIDLAVGDPVTPGAMKYNHKSMFDNESISLKSYNIETVLAEKLQTIFDRRVGNSRMKDYYDIYMMIELNGRTVDFGILKEAIAATFDNRKTLYDKYGMQELLEGLQADEGFMRRWNNYVQKNEYVRNVSFDHVLSAIRSLLDHT